MDGQAWDERAAGATTAAEAANAEGGVVATPADDAIAEAAAILRLDFGHLEGFDARLDRAVAIVREACPAVLGFAPGEMGEAALYVASVRGHAVVVRIPLFGNSAAACDCEDYLYRSLEPGGALCKHGLAVMLVGLLGADVSLGERRAEIEARAARAA